MSNSFLFIVPLTPRSHLTPLREKLQQLCFKSLLCQTYDNWKVLLIGEEKPQGTDDMRFIHIAHEGYKELKLQYAVKAIHDNKIDSDYIIRLDDDDLFNPTILEKYKQSQADVIVDLEHAFVEWGSKYCSKQFRPWFPNTCLHKSKCALDEFGEIDRKGIEQINSTVSLIETNHAKMHNYYKGKKVLFEKKDSIYLRVLNRDSITSNAGETYEGYLKSFGNWSINVPDSFKNYLSEGQNNKLNLKKSAFSILKDKTALFIAKRNFIKQF